MQAKPYQKPDQFIERPGLKSDRNLFYLSHAHVSTFSMGKIIPFFLKETLPGDFWTISCEFFARFARLYLPIMHRINHEIAYFYIPNRILWPGTTNNSWEYFIYHDDSVEAPYLLADVATVLSNTNSLPEYMGVPTPDGLSTNPQIVNLKLSAFQLNAYLKVFDEYYRNDQIQDPRWFPLTFGNNTGSFIAAGALSPFLTPLRRLWNRDMFTSATPTPQTGANILVPIMRNDSVDVLDPNWTYKGPTVWKKWADDTPAPNGAMQTDVDGHTLVNNAGLQDVYLDIQETSATIRDLRFNIMLTEFLELDLRAGDKYRDKHDAYWNIDPQPLTVDRPLYLGGKHGRVVISEVMASATNVTDDTYVGDYSGQALALDSSRTVKYFCREHGFIMGLITVFPQTMYMNGLERMWSRTSRFDYAWPQFALIGDDAILGKEVNLIYDATEDYNDVPWGYQRRYYEYCYSNDVIAGQMRDTFLSFHLARVFLTGDVGSGVELNSEFITCTPDIARVFQVNAETGEDEIYSYIFNEARVLRKLPKFGIPGV